MAKIKNIRLKKEVAEEVVYTCRDCTFSYDWHEKGYNGDAFLCRCAYYTEGKYSKFLKDKQCKHFNKREVIGK